MKFYEKPMAMIENVELEDIMGSSADLESASLVEGLAEETGADSVIVFEW